MDDNAQLWIDVGKRIAKLRNKKQLTQKKLGERLGLSRDSVSQYENGKRPVPVLVLRKMAEYFRVTTDYLLCLSDDIAHHEVDTSKKYGLSKLSLYRLEGLKEAADADSKSAFQAINYLLTRGISSGFFHGIGEYIRLPHVVKVRAFKSNTYYEKFKAMNSEGYGYDADISALARNMDKKEHVLALNKKLHQLLERYWKEEDRFDDFVKAFQKECDELDGK